jgi:hypothetical protein
LRISSTFGPVHRKNDAQTSASNGEPRAAQRLLSGRLSCHRPGNSLARGFAARCCILALSPAGHRDYGVASSNGNRRDHNAEAFMSTQKIIAVAAVAAVAILTIGSATAQSPVEIKRKAQVADARPPTKVTVRKRSFLDPGTATKTGTEHYMDYATPPGDPLGRFQNNYGITWTRSPFPSCFDLAGFCH